MRPRTILYLISALALLQFVAQAFLQPDIDLRSLFRAIELQNANWDFRFGYGVCAASFPLIEAIMLHQIVQALRTGPIALSPLLATFALGNVIHCALSISYGASTPALFDCSMIVTLAAAILALKLGAIEMDPDAPERGYAA